MNTRGVLYIHSAPSALCPHIEWAVGGVLGMPVSWQWTGQPVAPGSHRTEWSWSGPVGTAAGIASALKGWQKLRFEITEEPTATSEGCRYSYTPTLGVHHATIGLHGDIMIPELRLKRAMLQASLDHQPVTEALEALLGTPWDDELEAFRHAGEDTPVRWMHHVV